MLRRKRDEIRDAIAAYENKLKQAQADLAHVNAALRLFKARGEPADFPPYVDLNRVLRRGETTKLCFEALAAEGPMDTRQPYLSPQLRRPPPADLIRAIGSVGWAYEVAPEKAEYNGDSDRMAIVQLQTCLMGLLAGQLIWLSSADVQTAGLSSKGAVAAGSTAIRDIIPNRQIGDDVCYAGTYSGLGLDMQDWRQTMGRMRRRWVPRQAHSRYTRSGTALPRSFDPQRLRRARADQDRNCRQGGCATTGIPPLARSETGLR